MLSDWKWEPIAAMACESDWRAILQQARPDIFFRVTEGENSNPQTQSLPWTPQQDKTGSSRRRRLPVPANPMPDRVIASSRLSSPASSWVLLDEFASIGHRQNAITATGVTSVGGAVEVSFELVDPPGAGFSDLSQRNLPLYIKYPYSIQQQAIQSFRHSVNNSTATGHSEFK
jgi:hypothetical protein